MKKILSFVFAAMFAATSANAVVINEFFADDAGGDSAEFVELFGTPGESLAGISLIVVDGDTGGSTTSSNFERVTVQIDFTTETIPADGFLVLGGGTTPNVDIGFSINTLQNGSQTYALVNTADIAFEVDDADDLTEAAVLAITANLIDGVGYTDGASDITYFGVPDISDGSGFAIDTARRIPNGVDTDSSSDWVTESTFPSSELADTAATPGSVNDPAPIPEPSTVALLMLGAVAAGAASMRSRLG